MSAYETLNKRKKQFESFLIKAIPLENQKFVNEMQSKTVEEFVLFFQTYVIPNKSNIPTLIDSILAKTNIQKDKINSDDLTKFEKYLKLFIDFIENLSKI